MAIDNTPTHASTGVTICTVENEDRLVVTGRAQAELIEILARLVLHMAEHDSTSDAAGLKQRLGVIHDNRDTTLQPQDVRRP